MVNRNYRGDRDDFDRDYRDDDGESRGVRRGNDDRRSVFYDDRDRSFDEQDRAMRDRFGYDEGESSRRERDDRRSGSYDYRPARSGYEGDRSRDWDRQQELGGDRAAEGGSSRSSYSGARSQFGRIQTTNAMASGGQHRGKGPKGYSRSDDRLREDVCDRLMDADDLDASNIEVSVKKGEVTLQGHVDSRQDKRRAEDCADQVTGIGHVQNNLRVGSMNSNQSGTASTNA